MIKMEEQIKEIEELVDLGNKLYKSIVKFDVHENPISEENANNYQFFLKNYEQWYSKAYSVIKVILPDRLNDFVRWYRDDKRKSVTRENYCVSDALRAVIVPNCEPCIASWSIRQQVGILNACKDCFASKLFDIQVMLQADVFDSEIDSAKHLQKKGFLRASGAICGVVIEKHLSQICSNRGIIIRKKDPGIGDYNDALKDNAYEVVEWRRIQHLADIRNLCDHNKDREPTKDELTELISGTEWLIKNIF